MMTNKTFCFVAIGGAYKQQQHLEPAETFELVKMPLDELLADIDDSKQVFQSLHLATIFKALRFLKKQGKM